jgi:hypothetical protein
MHGVTIMPVPPNPPRPVALPVPVLPEEPDVPPCLTPAQPAASRTKKPTVEPSRRVRSIELTLFLAIF